MGTMTSCSDFLDASNKSNVTAKQSFATKEGLNNLVNNAYQHLQNVYAAPLFTSCFSAGTDMYADARNKMNEALNTYETLTPENTDIKNLYTYLYSGIRAANSVSYYAQTAQVDEKTKGQLVGEARVLAAYEYYLLVNNFGGVPIMKDFLTTADTGYPKSCLLYTSIPTFFRRIVVSTDGSYISSPSRSTLPSILTPSTKSFIRFNVFKNVDLPQPDGPINAVTAFSCISTVSYTHLTFHGL